MRLREQKTLSNKILKIFNIELLLNKILKKKRQSAFCDLLPKNVLL